VTGIFSFLYGEIQWWHWLVLAMLLLTIEIIAPITWFLWVAVAALAMSLIVFLAGPMVWTTQLLLFGILGVASLVLAHFWIKSRPIKTDQPLLNKRGAQYVGRQFTLIEAIENGYGTVKVDDTRWRVSGPALVEGAKVIVTGLDGTTLQVKSAD